MSKKSDEKLTPSDSCRIDAEKQFDNSMVYAPNVSQKQKLYGRIDLKNDEIGESSEYDSSCAETDNIENFELMSPDKKVNEMCIGISKNKRTCTDNYDTRANGKIDASIYIDHNYAVSSDTVQNYRIRTHVTFQSSHVDKRKILDGSWFNDSHIDKLHQMLEGCSGFDPRSLYILFRERRDPHSVRVEPVNRNSHHLQILHSCEDECEKCLGGRWVCMYYDTCKIHIYDSLDRRRLHEDHVICLRLIFPFFDTVRIVFPKVQYQTNLDDCGPMSMAFATSILFKKDPSRNNP
ncbi:hypothetical protein QAD02_002585 [Eretmocerus hayati]|uniref:Uncharacterized protein n=1 Tax=Eretmocerus hayati TaxID=131215 RepID=A0ACC2NK89_9HYME|nr:hypothetical protein QAD02_002585 [Eretmocerus hayati]